MAAGQVVMVREEAVAAEVSEVVGILGDLALTKIQTTELPVEFSHRKF